MAVEKYIDLSTCYITERDNRLLADAAQGHTLRGKHFPIPAIYEYLEGYWVHCGTFHDDPDYPRQLREYGLSAEFIKLLEYGCDNCCWFLRLDESGDDSFDFPKFEW